jgi:ABC-2 type transport system permease protein
VFIMGAATVMATVLAAISGGWAYVPVALGLAAGAAGAGLAVAAVLSVRAPFPMPDARNLFAAGGSGAGCAVALLQLLGLIGQALLALPIALLAVAGLRWSGPLLAAVVLVGPLYGYLVWRAGIARAARFVQPRQPELLDAVSPRRKAA